MQSEQYAALRYDVATALAHMDAGNWDDVRRVLEDAWSEHDCKSATKVAHHVR